MGNYKRSLNLYGQLHKRHSNQDSGQKENKIEVGQATNRRYQSRHQKKERKTHPKVEEEVAEPLKQQEV